MKKLKKVAKELLQSASKIYHYRKDVISEGRLAELEKAVQEVHTQLKASDEVRLNAALGRLDGLLKKIGGKMYPKTFWNDNIEVALVAAIIVIGIRTFFFQPFIIPTNSMYPTYSGMNAVIYEPEAGAPGLLNRIFGVVTSGARHRAVTAETSGDLRIPMDGSLRFFYEPVQGRKFLLFPTIRHKYTFFVGDRAHELVVPAEFDMERTLRKVFNRNTGTVLDLGNRFVFESKKPVVAGEDILRFDITLGDALFVDRLSYHFVEPKVGDPFVFRTDAIQQEIGRFSNDFTNKYYIKRLAGVGGETLEIRDGTLLVDGKPRDEVEAFGRNERREGEYGGYVNTNLLRKGYTMQVPEDTFVALGDNSANSLDSRYWGFVPEESVIGKAFFIYFPFTERWGIAE